ncbi:hypothetical protein FIBSPDRAFT_879500 [Athelia psychrophila]|uniref:Uncharacterized protein n=1 Tax=Athelia psychrophila TaxID=1759441 RepID=A0A167TXG4_9AGAM|nr:hypothetical protein FIBSPDRAFT_880552 [Fibularhizoctonia sp. CBS 109695]KZP02128.1 hypothetical protein FIBSPDRAFT_880551 [Fibularhizoctonia sp. CBS 109695]KZP03382.1 hypothetical protein FIBSPDRAFT_879500 [Fibularhizoctonia sp. CBS 109695]
MAWKWDEVSLMGKNANIAIDSPEQIFKTNKAAPVLVGTGSLRRLQLSIAPLFDL